MRTSNNNRSKKTGTTKSKRRKRTIHKPRLSWIVKPEKMGLEEWQIKLRQNIAQEEAMGCQAVDDKNSPGEYVVSNLSTKNKYKVVYRGYDSPWNYCSCMDFKSSQLGTCKHLEKVKLWIGGQKNLRVHKELPSYTSVYLSYKGERQVKIRIGSEHRDEYEMLASRFFDKEGVLLPGSYSCYMDFLVEAVNISPSFRFYQDAMDYIIERREQLERTKIEENLTDNGIDSLVHNATLYPYQREGVRFAFKQGRAIIADEMGLGKTIQAITAAELFQKCGYVETVLIVCPTSLKYQWKREIEKFTGKDVLVIEGNHLKRKVQYDPSVAYSYKIVSYNAVANDIKLLGSLSFDMLIMDEVQRLKNWKTQIAQAARKITSRYAVILSGTPLENRLEELFSVMQLVDQYCLGPFYKFKNLHIETSELGKVIAYKNLNQIGEKLKSRLIRRTKKQVRLQQPGRQDKNLFVPMTETQMEMHNEQKSIISRIMQKWKRMKFLSEADRNRLMLCLAQMRMLCDSTFILDQQSRHDTKVDEVINIIVDLFDGNDEEKVVVFSQLERMTRLIAGELEKKGIGFANLHGGVPSKQRKDLIDNFSDSPECRVFLSTDAGSTGLNLQAASTVINIDLPWNPAVLEQRIARAYRIGQERNVQVINLVATDTIEERMLDTLRFKSAMFEGVLDNGADTIFTGDKSKLDQMMETLNDMMQEETPEQPVAINEYDTEQENDLSEEEPELPFEPYGEETAGQATSDAVSSEDNNNHSEESGASTNHTPSASESDYPAQKGQTSTSGGSHGQGNHSAPSSSHKMSSNPKELVAQGMSFFASLAETLKSPESTEQLLDSIVTTDEKTGKTSLNIPVPDKDSVRNVLGLLGKLFG